MSTADGLPNSPNVDKKKERLVVDDKEADDMEDKEDDPMARSFDN